MPDTGDTNSTGVPLPDPATPEMPEVPPPWEVPEGGEPTGPRRDDDDPEADPQEQS